MSTHPFVVALYRNLNSSKMTLININLKQKPPLLAADAVKNNLNKFGEMRIFTGEGAVRKLLMKYDWLRNFILLSQERNSGEVND